MSASAAGRAGGEGGATPFVDLYWLPLGAGGRSVRQMLLSAMMMSPTFHLAEHRM